ASTSEAPELTTELLSSWESVAMVSVNDFESVIRPRWPAIDALLERGDSHGVFYRMSGSGSTVFEIPGITMRPGEANTSLPPLVVPPGTKSIVTRTAESVVPVEILD
ncbi:MAG: hypothetical protein ABJB95_08805, partial [Gemmatimonadales bacterium]